MKEIVRLYDDTCAKRYKRTSICGLVLILLTGLFSVACEPDNESTPASYSTWTHYGGGPEQSKYFEAEQITPENAGQLQLAWMYPTNDEANYHFSPIVVDTLMFVIGKNYSLIAIDARTGDEIWIHTGLQGITRRGINYWESEDGSDKRLLFTLDNSIQAIDARTGKSISSFGTNGYVDMREGLNREPSSIRRMQAMMPGVLFEDLLILGSAPGEGYFSPPGYVRAYNVVTGDLKWTFHTIPLPGEFGHDTWPEDAYKYVGGVNVWSEISVDSDRGIAYLPIGSPTYDFYGADRKGSNLFGNSLVAVNARTGERIWHFQTVHHDLWDYDLSSAPQLITVNREGTQIDAVAVATKHGFVFVFDRETGEPVFPIEEREFPSSEMPGEESWPTQPIPAVVPDFTRHEVTKETLNPYLPEETRKAWLERLDSARSGLFVPPSDKYETIMMPGALGGASYGNTASNPEKGLVYIMSEEYGSVYRLYNVEENRPVLSASALKRIKSLYENQCQTCHGKDMAGAAGPSLTEAGKRLMFNDFKNIITEGKGLMPAFVHVDDRTLFGLYRYMGGTPAGFRFGGEEETVEIEGPVVASGGAEIREDSIRAEAMSDYPTGVEAPEARYSTDYGTEWQGLLSPPWATLTAYDLNEGTIIWRQPIGLDSAYAKGDKSFGAPAGTIRKGMVVTSTGVVFATGKGGMLYAFDAYKGTKLWETTLSHETSGQPVMYEINGKQYLVINSSYRFDQGSYDNSKKPGALPKGYLVFSLPESNSANED